MKLQDNGRYFIAPGNVKFDKRFLLKDFINKMSLYFNIEFIYDGMDNIPAQDFVEWRIMDNCVPYRSYKKKTSAG